MNAEVIAATILISAFASFVQGFSGFGNALIMVPLLCLVMDIHRAVPVSIIVCFLVGPYLTFINRRAIDYRSAAPLVIGGLATVPVGVYALSSMDGKTACAVLGAAIVFLVLGQRVLPFSILGKPKLWKASIAGIMAGLLGGAFNTSGPPVVVYLHMTTEPKQARATMYFVFLTIGTAITLGHIAHGGMTLAVLITGLIAGPFSILGAHLGGMLAERTSPDRFRLIVTWMLVGLGAYLVGAYFV